MNILNLSRSRLGRLLFMGAIVGGFALPFPLSGQSDSTYDFEHLTPGPLDQRDGWSLSTNTKEGWIYATEPSGEYMGGNAIGMDGVAGIYIGGRIGSPTFADATSITAEVYLGPHNGRTIRIFGITDGPFQNSHAGIMFGNTDGNNFNIRGAAFGSTITSETWAQADTWYRITLSWSEPDAEGNRDVVLSGYDLTNGAPVGDNGIILEANVTAAFFGPDPSNYVGFGVYLVGDGAGSSLVGSVTHTGRGSAPLSADFGSVRYLKMLNQLTSAPVKVEPVSEGSPVYSDTADVVTALPSALSGNLAIKTANDFTGQAHLFDGENDFVRLDGTRQEFQHFLQGKGKASFRVKYDEILARGYGPDRSFFLSANGNIEGAHVDFNVGVSQAGNWWVSLGAGSGYVVLEMDITPAPVEGIWYDVEVDLDAGTFSVDGIVLRNFTPINTLPPESNPVSWQNDLHFGFTPNEQRHFKGELTEVKFEDGAGNTTGHWRLDQAEDFVVADLSGNGHEGTVSSRARPLEDLASYIGFVVDRPTTVYVAYDENATVPAWLQNHFALNGLQVQTTAGAFNLWERDVDAREQVSLLFDNTAWEPADNNYWVILSEGPDAITGSADSAFFRTGVDSSWRLNPHHWTLTADAGSALHTATMISSIDGLSTGQGFETTARIRVPRLQNSGDNAFGFILLGDSDDSSAGIRAEWLPRAGDGMSRLQIVDASNGTILDQVIWNGLTPTAINNDAGPTDRTDEVLFEEGSRYFTGDGPILAEGFEAGAAGWTSGSYNATASQWEIGVPKSGPSQAYSGSNVVATRLNGGYDSQSQSWLRSPVVDLTEVSDAKLTFQEYSDVDTDIIDGEVFHYTSVSVLDADTLALIQELALYSEDITAWRKRELDLTAFAGQRIIIEFGFYNDDFMELAGDGWYLDEIQVTEGLQRNIVKLPENLTLDGTLYGLATDNAGVSDSRESYLQFTVDDRSATGNDGVTVFVAWDARATGQEPDWLRATFTLTDHLVEVSGGAGHHRLWAREYADGELVTLGGASAAGAGPFVPDVNNYFVLFGDARPGLENFYTLTAEGMQENGGWTLSFSLSDGAGTEQTVVMTTESTLIGNSIGLFARHPGATGGTVTHAPIWEIFHLLIDTLNDSPNTGFENWRAEHFAGQLDDPAISGPDAAPAGDGVTNLMKYALKLDPWTPATSADLPWLDADGENILVLIYWERTDITDIEYIPEISENLIDWNSGEPHVVKVPGLVDQEANIQAMEAIGSVAADAPKSFIRLKVLQKGQ